MTKTWKIRSWNCATQSYDTEREVTLEQFRAEHKAACERAKAIHKANATQ